MASFASVRNHGWRTQAVWANIYRSWCSMWRQPRNMEVNLFWLADSRDTCLLQPIMMLKLSEISDNWNMDNWTSHLYTFPITVVHVNGEVGAAVQTPLVIADYDGSTGNQTWALKMADQLKKYGRGGRKCFLAIWCWSKFQTAAKSTTTLPVDQRTYIITLGNTPETAGGPDGHDQTLAVKKISFFFRKKNKIYPFFFAYIFYRVIF